jgi:hypothetical protein
MDSFFNNSFESNCSKIKSDFDGSSYKNYVYDGILFNPYKELYDNKGLKSYENLFSDIEAYERRGYEAYNKIYNEAYNKAYNNADIYGYDVESGNVPDNIVQNVFGENIGAGNRAYNDEASFVNMLVREYEAASANGGDMGVTDLSTVQKISDEIRNYNNSGGNVNISVGGVTQNISGNADAQDVMQIFTESLRRGINACGSRYMEENR